MEEAKRPCNLRDCTGASYRGPLGDLLELILKAALALESRLGLAADGSGKPLALGRLRHDYGNKRNRTYKLQDYEKRIHRLVSTSNRRWDVDVAPPTSL